VKSIILSIIGIALLALTACVRQASYPPYPIITSVAVSKTAASEYFANGNGVDSVGLTISFTDGEGGIGPVSLTTDPYTLHLCDHAYDSLSVADPFYNVYWYEYHAQHITTDSCLNYTQTAYVPDSYKNPAIAGTIEVYPGIECPPTGTVDTIYFSVFFKDRNGKVSNRMRTKPVIVTCQ
jgi:hypothetical protein